MDQQDARFHRMTEAPVRRLILSLAGPCIISMLVTAFYNMADTFFVGMLDSNAATGAVGIVFSMMAVIQAIGFFFGQGGGVYISQMVGRQDYDEASNMAATSFVYALAAGSVICVLGQIFLEPLAYLLGSTDTILPYAEDYLRVILLGAPWMAASLVLNNQLRFQGSASYAMVGIVAGAVLNIALDPLLIFVFDMGIAGAGWATIFSQFVSFCLLLAGCAKGENIHIKLKNLRFKWFYFDQIIRGGLPSLSRQILASLATACLNNTARPYGDAAIAAMGVVQRIMMFGASAMLGFGQGFQPVCGINFAANLHHRVREGFWFCVKFSTLFLALAGLAGGIFAPQLIALFRNDPAVIEFGSAALRFQCATFWMHGWIVMSNMMQQSTGQTLPATFNSVARQGLFFIPSVLILPFFLDAVGLQMAQSVADAAAFAIGIPIQFIILRRLNDGTLKRSA